MKRKITLKDIAKELDISISAVSKALKNSPQIGLETRKKVHAFAKLYNYKPNNIALSLKNRKTKNIGVIIPDIVHHFFTTVVNGIEKIANEKGYNVIVCFSDESLSKEVINMEMLAGGSVDGFILSLSSETQRKEDYIHLKETLNQGIPIVLFDRVTDKIECDKVIINDKIGSFNAVSKLIEDGRKKIGLITAGDYLSVSKLRTDGYYMALTKNNIPISTDLILELPGMSLDRERIENFIISQDLDAVFAVNEIFAIYGMKVAQQNGYKIPEDISFIGFTNGPLSYYFNPGLTVVAQHGIEIGKHAAQLLINRIETEENKNFDTEEVFYTKIIETSIVERESTRNTDKIKDIP